MPRFEPHPRRRPSVIAGASSGIGAATAAALAESGHPVALGARRVEECEKVADRIRAGGGEAFVHRLDVSDPDSVKQFAAAATEALGPVEILVSGAGDLESSLVHEMDAERFSAQVQVHLVGAHRLVSELVPDMVRRRRGDIVFIGSDVVRAPRPRMGAYVPSKAGVEAMARALQMELEGTGVRASIVRPGPTLTGMGMSWDPGVVGPLLQDWSKWGFARHPYFLRPSDIAAAVHNAVSVPRGVHIALVEVQPEAPLKKEQDDAS
ncbi:SDR family oxidoreductase [Amycolatopsis rhizosphaerae]|uniref:SDR family oxidoreductase n=1 Tax=Amycolatopsis rhizosphaerae TaxID=2053003 RepID=A0A558D327_9PSEU|nr:SDR family oxidoreductase [Amycolatopsis rhizosphaerae]TVT55422.1 SDR family oxidoreductase [Amycolatopsis rhizosphaerae]